MSTRAPISAEASLLLQALVHQARLNQGQYEAFCTLFLPFNYQVEVGFNNFEEVKAFKDISDTKWPFTKITELSWWPAPFRLSTLDSIATLESHAFVYSRIIKGMPFVILRSSPNIPTPQVIPERATELFDKIEARVKQIFKTSRFLKIVESRQREKLLDKVRVGVDNNVQDALSKHETVKVYLSLQQEVEQLMQAASAAISAAARAAGRQADKYKKQTRRANLGKQEALLYAVLYNTYGQVITLVSNKMAQRSLASTQNVTLNKVESLQGCHDLKYAIKIVKSLGKQKELAIICESEAAVLTGIRANYEKILITMNALEKKQTLLIPLLSQYEQVRKEVVRETEDKMLKLTSNQKVLDF